jgi:hypothetical protein
MLIQKMKCGSMDVEIAFRLRIFGLSEIDLAEKWADDDPIKDEALSNFNCTFLTSGEVLFDGANGSMTVSPITLSNPIACVL